MGRPRILILHTGGTFGMELTAGSTGISASIAQLSPSALKKRFLQNAREIQDLAHCDVEILYNLDSAHIGPPQWLEIANHILDQSKKYDGIVLLHGTDTLAYTAAALSYLLRPCPTPVVITGAQRPLTALRNDARNNLVSAVEIAATGPRPFLNQVSVVFGNQLFAGSQVRKKSSTDFAAFESPNSPPLALIGTSIQYAVPKQQLKTKKPHRPRGNFSQNVLMFHVTPGFPIESLKRLNLQPGELDAIVLIIFASGTAPTHRPEFKTFLSHAKKQNLPIVLVTEGNHATQASTELRYSAGQELLQAGCHPALGMTPENAYVKTCLILGQPQGRRHFARLWRQF